MAYPIVFSGAMNWGMASLSPLVAMELFTDFQPQVYFNLLAFINYYYLCLVLFNLSFMNK